MKLLSSKTFPLTCGYNEFASVTYYFNSELLTLRVHTSIWNLLKKYWQFGCTGLLRSSKLVHLDAKNLAFLTQNRRVESSEAISSF